jgi:hypothetical protein
MAYVPQTAWCQNLALRDNIIFGEEVDEALYDDVIDACALGLDLQILPQGDQTKVRATPPDLHHPLILVVVNGAA